MVFRSEGKEKKGLTHCPTSAEQDVTIVHRLLLCRQYYGAEDT